jgi:hypothetical protein
VTYVVFHITLHPACDYLEILEQMIVCEGALHDEMELGRCLEGNKATTSVCFGGKWSRDPGIRIDGPFISDQ